MPAELDGLAKTDVFLYNLYSSANLGSRDSGSQACIPVMHYFSLFDTIPCPTRFEGSSRLLSISFRSCRDSVRMTISSANRRCKRYWPFTLIPCPFQSSVLKTSPNALVNSLQCNWIGFLLFSCAGHIASRPGISAWIKEQPRSRWYWRLFRSPQTLGREADYLFFGKSS